MSVDKFLLADDNTLLRASLAKLIGLWRPDAVIDEASDGREAVEKARKLKPSVVLMDIRMPNVDGIEATRLIKAELPETKIIMLTVSEEEEDLFEAISSGAHGYLLKDMQPEELFEMLEGALRGEAVVAPAMAQRILHAFVTQAHRWADAGGSTAAEPWCPSKWQEIPVSTANRSRFSRRVRLRPPVAAGAVRRSEIAWRRSE